MIKEVTHMSRFSRRQFLQTATAASAALCATPYFFPQKAFSADSANDRLVMGCIGTGSMGMGDARHHSTFADIVAVCDVDEAHALEAKNNDRVGKGKADVYKDYRKVLERKDIDVVSVVTPDHWHIKIAIEALQAGKHVFCQKPLTLTLEENQLIRAACKKYNKVLQVGTQQRDDKSRFLRAIRMVRKGLLGEITNVVVGINGAPTSDALPIVDPPSTLDWDFWLGQAPKVPYRENKETKQGRAHYEFRWWYEYSGGKFTDWGAHHVDIAQWAIGMDTEGTGPSEIDGTNSKHPVPYENGYTTLDDRYNTSHEFDIVCKFPGNITMHVDSTSDNGVLFEGKKGRIFVNREKITGKPIEENWDKDLSDSDYVDLFKGKPVENHKANFFRCISEGGLPVSDVFTHVQTMNTCHLCTIAARFGRKIKWDPKAEKIVGDDQAQSFFARQQRKGFEIPGSASDV